MQSPSQEVSPRSLHLPDDEILLSDRANATPECCPDLQPRKEKSLPKTQIIDDDSPIEGTTERPLLVMSIDFEDGKKYNLPVMEHDDPYELAKTFCRQYELNEDIVEALANDIYAKMEEVLQNAVSKIKHSARQCLVSQRERLPSSRDSDLLEPDYKEEKLKRRQESEEEQSLEQIEKHFSEEAEANHGKVDQKTFSSLSEPKDLPIIEKFGDYSAIGKHACESIYMDMSMCSIIKVGELIDENKIISDIRREGILYNRKGSREPEEKEIQDFEDNRFHNRSQYDRNRLGVKNETDARSNSRSCERPRTANSPGRSIVENSRLSPKKSPAASKTYGQLFQQKGAQKVRQRSESTVKSRGNQGAEISKGNGNTSSMSTTGNSKNLQIKTGDFGEEGKPEALLLTTRTRSAKRMRSVEECSFKPEINKTSAKMVEEREKQRQSLGATPHQRLYNQSKIREAQQEQKAQLLGDECTFKPAINNYSGAPALKMSFEERNSKFRSRMKKLEELRNPKEMFDAQTGKPFFQPMTGRAPSTERNNERLPIGEYLYQKKVGDAGTPSKRGKTAEGNSLKLNEKSQAIFNKKCVNKLEELFQNLDSDKDGVISAEKVDINAIGAFELQVISSILCAMEDHGQPLSREDFMAQGLKLIKNLCITDRDHFLLGTKRPMIGTSGLATCRPEASKRSAETSRVKRVSGEFSNLYDKVMKEKKAQEEKMKKEQEKKKDLELQDCTFRPFLYKKPTRITKKETVKE